MKRRTRGAKTLNGLAAKFMANLRAQASIPKALGSNKVYSGKGRSFEAAFAGAFWTKHKNALCAKYGQKIAPKDRCIDHKKPWAQIKPEAETVIVCKNGAHWEVALQS